MLRLNSECLRFSRATIDGLSVVTGIGVDNASGDITRTCISCGSIIHPVDEIKELCKRLGLDEAQLRGAATEKGTGWSRVERLMAQELLNVYERRI